MGKIFWCHGTTLLELYMEIVIKIDGEFVLYGRFAVCWLLPT